MVCFIGCLIWNHRGIVWASLHICCIHAETEIRDPNTWGLGPFSCLLQWRCFSCEPVFVCPGEELRNQFPSLKGNNKGNKWIYIYIYIYIVLYIHFHVTWGTWIAIYILNFSLSEASKWCNKFLSDMKCSCMSWDLWIDGSTNTMPAPPRLTFEFPVAWVMSFLFTRHEPRSACFKNNHQHSPPTHLHMPSMILSRCL